jgi:subtilisin
MASKRSSRRTPSSSRTSATAASAGTNGIEAMLLAAQERGGDSFETGRYLITYKEGAMDAGRKALSAKSMRTADARDFTEAAVNTADIGDADAVLFPEIGVALITADAFESRRMATFSSTDSDDPMHVIEPEYFVFADADPTEYMRGFLAATNAIAAGLGYAGDDRSDSSVDAQVLGHTWGLIACRASVSARTGAGISVAVLDTGMDLTHPDFRGRAFAFNTFVGEPVQDRHSHGTHCIGTACGPLAPAGTTPRYGVAHQAKIFVGKVLTNAGSGTTASVLAGMNWAIANRCAVISMSLGGRSPVQAAYTAAGNAALNNGCLIIAAAGNESGAPTGAPANSPSIMSVASLDRTLTPSAFSSAGKVEISGPGRDVFSSVPMPTRYGTKSGTSMATPHVAGCAALWAQTDPTLRSTRLWRRLQDTARVLPFAAARVGRGLVQAP